MRSADAYRVAFRDLLGPVQVGVGPSIRHSVTIAKNETQQT